MEFLYTILKTDVINSGMRQKYLTTVIADLTEIVSNI